MKNLINKVLVGVGMGESDVTEGFYVSSIVMTYWPYWAYRFYKDNLDTVNIQVGDTLIRNKITSDVTIKKVNDDTN